jgi:hypothetical protein
MTVYVAYIGGHHENAYMVGAFTSLEDAKAAIGTWIHRAQYYCYDGWDWNVAVCTIGEADCKELGGEIGAEGGPACRCRGCSLEGAA